MLAECLFFIAYQTVTTTEQVLLLLEQCQQCGDLLGSEAAAPSAVYTLVATFACQCDRKHSLIDASTGASRTRANEALLNDQKFVNDVKNKLTQQPWKSESLRAALLLIWAVFVIVCRKEKKNVMFSFCCLKTVFYCQPFGTRKPDGSVVPTPFNNKEIDEFISNAVHNIYIFLIIFDTYASLSLTQTKHK